MASEAPYFTHDYNARNDRKLLNLKYKHGMTGIGIYWCLVEMLYEEHGGIAISEIPNIAKDLRTQVRIIESVINNFELFKVSDGFLTSSAVFARISKRIAVSSARSKASLLRWKSDPNALQMESNCNAIKEKKRKEKEMDTNASNNGEVFKLYENNIGALTPFISEKIGSLVDDYGETWVCEAIGKATAAEKRNLNYVEGILKGWKRDGKGIKKARGDPGVWNVH